VQRQREREREQDVALEQDLKGTDKQAAHQQDSNKCHTPNKKKGEQNIMYDNFE